MEYKKIQGPEIKLSVLGLGTWAFGSDAWWGKQDDKDSFSVLEKFIESGINLIDTAPVYGKGHSEELLGKFLKEKNRRKEVILATKLGLSWLGPKIYNDLKRKAMIRELDESRKRLQTDYIDIYQVHWPDSRTPIRETAETMYEFYNKGIIKAVGLSNYSVEQMKEFMRYSPLHTMQPPYNMFSRQIEEDIIPFCIENNISVISYIPLHSGILTGKFFFEEVKIPSDLCRKKHKDLKPPLFFINKEILQDLKEIALKYNKTLTQLVSNWTYNKKGITSILVGARDLRQLEENMGSVGWKIKEEDLTKIESILIRRDEKIRMAKSR